MMVPSYYENDYTSDWDALMSAGSGAAPYTLFAPAQRTWDGIRTALGGDPRVG